MITVDHPLVHEPGVFWKMPDAEYHAAVALSASGCKSLRVSALNWYMLSPLNPMPHEEPSTIQQTIGTATHKRILEGSEAFYEQYAPSLERDAYPNALETNEDLMLAIIGAGGPKPRSNMRKAELIDMLRSFVPDAEIWQDLQSEHGRQNSGKTLLRQEQINQIEIAAAMIERHPDPYLKRAFRDGAPEVSIFWTDEATGVPCKARLDYLKPRLIVDLKTFSNPYGMSIDKAIARAMANYRYHVQAAWYLEAAKVAELFDDWQFKGTKEFLFVFQQQGIAPVARGKLFGAGLVMDIARQEIEQAKLTWARCWEHYGPDEPWLDTTGITQFADEDFPAYIGDP